MKIKFLNQTRHYDPKDDLADFIRRNELDWYDPRVVIKIMKSLYPLFLSENYPEYDDDTI